MNKENLSFADVEQLLTELAQHDLQVSARDDAQTELMRGAARGEIRRVFFRRRCLRVGGGLAVVAALGGSLTLMLPEEGADAGLAETQSQTMPPPPSSVPSTIPVSYKTRLEHGSDACELVIYSVPM